MSRVLSKGLPWRKSKTQKVFTSLPSPIIHWIDFSDPYKSMTFTYNHLNLPKLMTFVGVKGGGTNTIEILYDAAGTKLRKTVKTGATVNYTQDYISGIEYRDGVREAIYTAEGRVKYTSPTTTRYEYNIKDHLGNTRISFSDLDNNGVVNETNNPTTNEVLQENHYYPFGLNMDGPWMNDAALDNKYQYNGKEFNDDFGLNLNDYGARWYDASVGRWMGVDALTDFSPSWTPYRYGFDNPIRFFDPTGHYEMGYIGLSDDEDKNLREKYSDKKEYRKAKTEAIKEKREAIKDAISTAKEFLNNNPEVGKAFQDFSGVKAGTQEWDNLWNDNGSGPIIGAKQMERTGLTESINGQSTVTLNSANDILKNLATILHEYVHVGDNLRSASLEGTSGVPGYNQAMQLSALLDVKAYSISIGARTQEGWMNNYGPNSPKGYPKILDSTGKAIGIEIGYAFEKAAFGTVLMTPSDYSKAFSSYVKSKK